MKRYNYTDGKGYVIVGTAREIKNIEKGLYKEYRFSGKVSPVFTTPAQYNMNRLYGVSIYGVEDEFFNMILGKQYVILSGDTVLKELIDGIIA